MCLLQKKYISLGSEFENRFSFNIPKEMAVLLACIVNIHTKSLCLLNA